MLSGRGFTALGRAWGERSVLPKSQKKSAAASRFQSGQHYRAANAAPGNEQLEHELQRDLAAARAELARHQSVTQAELNRAHTRLEQMRQEVALAQEALFAHQAEAEAARDAQRLAIDRLGAEEQQTLRLRDELSHINIELQRQRQVAIELEARVEKFHDTLSFRLGYLLIHAFKSWRAFFRLPLDLWQLRKEAEQRRQQRPQLATGRTQQQLVDETMQLFLTQGHQAAARHAESEARDDHTRAAALTQLAKALKTGQPLEARQLARRAYELSPQPFRAKWLAFLHHDCGDIVASAQLVRALPPNTELKASEHARIRQIEGLARLRERLPAIPPHAACPFQPMPDSSLYVSASALPFHTTGYTVRTHALVSAIADAGWHVNATLRPGYPADRGLEVPGGTRSHLLEDISYRHLSGPHLYRSGLDQFVAQASGALEELAREVRPALIHAASNHANALPALIAARRVGVPFVYEVRGLWEITAATRNIDWEQTERYALERDLEALVASNADLVFTLTQGLADELVQRGVSRERIVLLPNSVDSGRFAPREKDLGARLRFGVSEAAFTLVYAGSLLHYEGLDDLVRAVAQLQGEGREVALVLAGDGEAKDSLKQLAQELGVTEQVKLVGRVAPDEVPALWSIADAAAFPRKPFRVCELVSPLKPLEPMAMQIPVVASDVAALKEMLQHGVTGLIHRAGDANALAEQLRTLADNPDLREQLGQAAREAVLTERTWEVAGERVVGHYRKLLRGSTGPLRAVSRLDAHVPNPARAGGFIERV